MLSGEPMFEAVSSRPTSKSGGPGSQQVPLGPSCIEHELESTTGRSVSSYWSNSTSQEYRRTSSRLCTRQVGSRSCLGCTPNNRTLTVVHDLTVLALDASKRRSRKAFRRRHPLDYAIAENWRRESACGDAGVFGMLRRALPQELCRGETECCIDSRQAHLSECIARR